MTICHAKQEDEKELVFKFGFVGGLAPRSESRVSMYAYSFTRLRAGAPSRGGALGRGAKSLVGQRISAGQGMRPPPGGGSREAGGGECGHLGEYSFVAMQTHR